MQSAETVPLHSSLGDRVTLSQKNKERGVHRDREESHVVRGRDGSGTDKNRLRDMKMPSAAGSQQQPGDRPGAGSPSQPPEGTGPAATLTLDFWPAELWDSKLPLFTAAEIGVLCQGSLRI